MTKKNTQNEFVMKDYFCFLKHADGKSEASIRLVERSIRRFEQFTKSSNFKLFNQKQAINYKSSLLEQGLAKATILSEVNKLKRFLNWLSRQAGYKIKILVDDVEYLSLV